MGTFFYILINILLPIFILIAVGFVAQKILKFDIRTLTRLNIYIFVPSVLFLKIYETNVPFEFFFQVLVYILMIQIIMMLIGIGISKLFSYKKSVRSALCNSLLFFNSGNYGLPLVDLVFNGDPVAVASQVFIMLIQNITTNTWGVFQASSGNSSAKKALRNVLKMPSIYVISAVILVKIFRITVPQLLLIPIEYTSRGFIAIALITLGAQLADIKIEIKIRDILTPVFIRLVISPILGFLIIWAMGIRGVLGQALVIGVSTPSAVNTALLAKEFDNEPAYASQIVFASTLLSALTITLVIYITGMIF